MCHQPDHCSRLAPAEIEKLSLQVTYRTDFGMSMNRTAGKRQRRGAVANLAPLISALGGIENIISDGESDTPPESPLLRQNSGRRRRGAVSDIAPLLEALGGINAILGGQTTEEMMNATTYLPNPGRLLRRHSSRRRALGSTEMEDDVVAVAMSTINLNTSSNMDNDDNVLGKSALG